MAPSRYAISTALCCTDSSPKTASHRLPCPWEDRKVSLEPRHKAYFAYRITIPTGETREGLSASKAILWLCQRVTMYHKTPGAQQRPGTNQEGYKPGGVWLTPTTHVSCGKKAHPLQGCPSTGQQPRDSSWHPFQPHTPQGCRPLSQVTKPNTHETQQVSQCPAGPNVSTEGVRVQASW